ncbi:putative small GTPase, P-loop containing nucleoside triphosphate hydrolase [Helianthus annuus]|nr:putative small GTPase, P-loop containing nucleoside triphosphate hydrolase [Helianthus annuus]
MRHQQGSLYFHGSRLKETTGKMTRIGRRMVRLDIRWSVVLQKVSVFREILRFIWDRLLACSIGKPVRYRRLSRRTSSPADDVESLGDLEDPTVSVTCNGYETDSDLVTLKISLLGDCQIGKTSFMIKYVGDEQENRSIEMAGLNLMDKTLSFGGARIAFRIWDVGGDKKSNEQLPIACKDAVAILFMFDLTSRCTLHNVLEWYLQARKWNKV